MKGVYDENAISANGWIITDGWKKVRGFTGTARADLESGKLDQAMQKMPKKEAATMQNLLKDPKKMEQLMNAPQAKALYEKLMGKQ